MVRNGRAPMSNKLKVEVQSIEDLSRAQDRVKYLEKQIVELKKKKARLLHGTGGPWATEMGKVNMALERLMVGVDGLSRAVSALNELKLIFIGRKT